MNKKVQTSFSNEKPNIKVKKISFFSAIMLVIGSSIGAGIFLKNGEILRNVQGSIVLSLISWIVSIIAVIAMGISLAEVTSANKNNNQGIIGWVKSFNTPFIHKMTKYFMAFIYLPLDFFCMPYYAIMTIQDAFGWQTNCWVAAGISLIIALWFFLTSGISSWWGNVQNWIITSVKFLPLIFAGLIGFVMLMCNQKPTASVIPSILPDEKWKIDHALFCQIFPGLGIIGSIPSIIFSFDGFYTSASLRSEMEKPEKIVSATTIGLVIVSVIDMLISLSLLFGSTNGKINGINWFNDNNAHWVITIIDLLIAFGILGITNGLTMYNTRFYDDLIKNNEIIFADKFQPKLRTNKPLAGLLYSACICPIVFIFFTLVGSLGYMDTSGYSLLKMYDINNMPLLNEGYDSHATAIGNLNNLYSMCDLVANWSSMLIFVCITISIIGCLINRKTNRVKIEKNKWFVACAWISSLIIGIGILFIVISSIVNIGIVANWYKDINTKIFDTSEPINYTKEQWLKDLVGAIMTLIILIIIVLSCVIPSWIETRKNKLRKITK